ncbi:MAG: hypothetical protein IJO76_03540 [Clostridia bacterium]|nr:hypothetical protein [Clostridia bacterium]
MSKRVKEITEETFSDAVDYAHFLNKKLHFNVLSQKIILPLGSILLALHATILFLGVIYLLVRDNPEKLVAFNAFPFIPACWNGIWGAFSNITENLYVKIFLVIVFLFIVPFAVCSITALIVFCLTKSKSPAIEGSTVKRAKNLYNYLEKAPQTQYIVTEGKPVMWRRICGIVSGICIIGFAFYYYGSSINQNNNFLAAFSVLFQSDKSSDDILICLSFGVIFYFAYVLLHIVFSFIIQPCCDSYKEWKKFTDEAERHWLSVDKEECKRRKEDASCEEYDGWKYRNLEKTQYYKDKTEEYYAKYMGLPYETDEDKAEQLVRDIEDELSGGGWGNY